MPTFPQELGLNVDVKVSLQGIQEQRWVLRGRGNDVIQNLFALEVGPLVVRHQLHASVEREREDFLHERNDLQSVEKESDQGLVKHMLLLRELPPQQGVRDEHQRVLEEVLLVVHELVTGLVVSMP